MEQRRQPRWARCSVGQGLHVRPNWEAHEVSSIRATHLEIPAWNNVGGQECPKWDRCSFKPLHVRPKWATHESILMRFFGVSPHKLIWAPHGQTRRALRLATGSMSAPSGEHMRTLKVHLKPQPISRVLTNSSLNSHFENYKEGLELGPFLHSAKMKY